MDIYIDRDTCKHIASIGENIAKAINRLAAAQERRNEILQADTARNGFHDSGDGRDGKRVRRGIGEGGQP